MKLYYNDLKKGNMSYKFVMRLPEKLKSILVRISKIRGISMSFFIKEGIFLNIKKYEYLLNEPIEKRKEE